MFFSLLLACKPGTIILDSATPSATDGGASGTDGGASGTDGGAGTDSGGAGGDTASGTDGGTDGSTDGGTGSGTTGLPESIPVSGVSAAYLPEVVTVVEVSWTQDSDADSAWIEFSFENDEWTHTPAQPQIAGEHTEALLGIPPETEVTYRLVNTLGDAERISEDYTVSTGTLPGDLVDAEVTFHDPTLDGGERWLLGSVDVSDNWYYGPFWVFILDRQGRYVWYQEVPDDRLALQAQVAYDGGHIVYEGSTYYVFDWSIEPTVTRTTLDGRQVDVQEIPTLGFTLDEIQGGDVLFVHDTNQDYVLGELSPDGTLREIWNCDTWLTGVGGRAGDCIPNTVIWSPASDTVLWSMFQNDTVVEVDRGSGEVLRQWGQLAGSWAVDPPEAMIDYQHYPNYTPAGTLLVSTHVLSQFGIQMAREFVVNDATETLEQVWSYSDEGAHYATYAGEATTTAAGNVLISYGTGGAIRELTPSGELAWEVLMQTSGHTHLIGHLTLLDDLYALNQGL